MGGKSSKGKKKKDREETNQPTQSDSQKDGPRSENRKAIMVDEFHEVVMEALRANFDLVTLNELDYYIGTRYEVDLDPTERKKATLNIVSELFFKGCLAIRAR